MDRDRRSSVKLSSLQLNSHMDDERDIKKIGSPVTGIIIESSEPQFRRSLELFHPEPTAILQKSPAMASFPIFVKKKTVSNETIYESTCSGSSSSANNSEGNSEGNNESNSDINTTSDSADNSSINAPNSSRAERNMPPLKSLMDLKFKFSESSESDLENAKQQALLFAQSLENLPTDLQYPTLKEFEQAVGISSEQTFSCRDTSIECGNETVTSSTEFPLKWPTPKSIEEVHQLCATELSEGTAQSQLALCLHLMESAYIADPNNDIPLPQDKAKQGGNALDGIFSNFKKVTAPTTLAEALVFESKKLLKLLANGGQNAGEGADAEAQFLLGSCYGMGALGWPINHKRALQWYHQAAKYGHPEAIYRTAVCYEMGIGTEKDGAGALHFFKKAARLSHIPGMYKLGIILMRGYCGAPVNKREAIVWLQRAACISMTPIVPGEKTSSTTIGGHGGIALPHALYALGVIHTSKECEDTSLISDPKYALKLFNDSARFGYAPSQSKLGQFYECGQICAEDEEKSIYWYSLAAKQNFPEACLGLSSWYLTGALKTNMLQQSDKEAFLWAQKAYRLSKSIRDNTLTGKVCFTLAVYHENGIGTEKSTEMATNYYKKAAQNGHPEALKMSFDQT